MHEGGGSSGRSDEALVTSVERSGCSKTAVANRAIGRSDRFQRRLSSRDGREMAGTSRVNREVYARFCGRLEVKFLRPTRQPRTPGTIERPAGYGNDDTAATHERGLIAGVAEAARCLPPSSRASVGASPERPDEFRLSSGILGMREPTSNEPGGVRCSFQR